MRNKTTIIVKVKTDLRIIISGKSFHHSYETKHRKPNVRSKKWFILPSFVLSPLKNVFPKACLTTEYPTYATPANIAPHKAILLTVRSEAELAILLDDLTSNHTLNNLLFQLLSGH